MQFQSKPGPAFLQIGSLSVLGELVPVVAEEDKVALVVHCDHTAAVEVRRLREQGGEHAADAVAGHGIEVVQDELGGVVVGGGAPVVRQGVAKFATGDAEGRGGAVGQVGHDQRVRGPVLFIPEQKVSVASPFRPLDDVLNLEILSLVILHIRYRLLDLLQELEQATLRPPIRRHQYLGCRLILKIRAKLVYLLLALNVLVLRILNQRLIRNPHALDRVRLALGHGCLAQLFPHLLLLEPVDHPRLLLRLSLPHHHLLPLQLVLDVARLPHDLLILLVLLHQLLNTLVQLLHTLLLLSLLRLLLRTRFVLFLSLLWSFGYLFDFFLTSFIIFSIILIVSFIVILYSSSDIFHRSIIILLLIIILRELHFLLLLR